MALDSRLWAKIAAPLLLRCINACLEVASMQHSPEPPTFLWEVKGSKRMIFVFLNHTVALADRSSFAVCAPLPGNVWSCKSMVLVQAGLSSVR